VDWRLLRAAIRTGRLETFEELVRDGFTASLDNDGLGLSPVVWTAMATGKKMQHHGIFDFEITRSPFFERPIEAWLRYGPSEFAVWRVVKVLHKLGLAESRLVTGVDRQGPSVWQILSRHNYRNLVVNYLVSFPAEKINGVFLAGHVYEAVLLRGDATGTDSGATNGFVYPVGLLDRSYGDIKPVAEGPRDVISIEEREFNYLAPLTLEILKGSSFHFVTFYTAWPDSFNHEISVEDYEMMLAGRYDRPLTRRFLDVYERIDDFLADIRRSMPDANLMLVSDHGVGPGYRLRQKIMQHDKAQGVFIVYGPDVRPGTRSEAVSMCDITPTVLHYFDVPVASDFDGTVVRQAFALPRAPREIPSYDPVVPNARVESSQGELDGVRERLKALGYIE
jgi:predicted AlkP superfamily phosphohydrolase/phosphomutase